MPRLSVERHDIKVLLIVRLFFDNEIINLPGAVVAGSVS